MEKENSNMLATIECWGRKKKYKWVYVAILKTSALISMKKKIIGIKNKNTVVFPFPLLSSILNANFVCLVARVALQAGCSSKAAVLCHALMSIRLGFRLSLEYRTSLSIQWKNSLFLLKKKSCLRSVVVLLKMHLKYICTMFLVFSRFYSWVLNLLRKDHVCDKGARTFVNAIIYEHLCSSIRSSSLEWTDSLKLWLFIRAT